MYLRAERFLTLNSGVLVPPQVLLAGNDLRFIVYQRIATLTHAKWHCMQLQATGNKYVTQSINWQELSAKLDEKIASPTTIGWGLPRHAGCKLCWQVVLLFSTQDISSFFGFHVGYFLRDSSSQVLPTGIFVARYPRRAKTNWRCPLPEPW